MTELGIRLRGLDGDQGFVCDVPGSKLDPPFGNGSASQKLLPLLLPPIPVRAGTPVRDIKARAGAIMRAQGSIEVTFCLWLVVCAQNSGVATDH